jgi:hypothetical protein
VLATGVGVAAASVNSTPAHVTRTQAAAVVAQASSPGGVQTVTPGQRITVGGGYTVSLTSQGLSIVSPKSSGMEKVDLIRVIDGRPGKWTGVGRGGASGGLFAGVYRVPFSASTRVTIRLGTRTLNAKVAKLAGKPGWGAFFVFDQHLAGMDMRADKPVVTVAS